VCRSRRSPRRRGHREGLLDTGAVVVDGPVGRPVKILQPGADGGARWEAMRRSEGLHCGRDLCSASNARDCAGAAFELADKARHQVFIEDRAQMPDRCGDAGIQHRAGGRLERPSTQSVAYGPQNVISPGAHGCLCSLCQLSRKVRPSGTGKSRPPVQPRVPGRWRIWPARPPSRASARAASRSRAW
jgi:hypothetical protein